MSRSGPIELVIATLNRDKGRELRALLQRPELAAGPFGGRLVTRWLWDFPGAMAPPETGSTLVENARIKADAAVRHTGLPALADDTGIEVDALDGRPGVHAARFAGPGATYEDNLRLLLHALTGVPETRRTARFRTVCVARFPDGSEHVGEGVMEGRIVESPRGRGGFGYDPIFEPEGSGGRTLAELSEDEKNAQSHRARAVRDLIRKLL